MSQTILIPSRPPTTTYRPSSPDPTPLRLLAFSVAEAALQPDPNSPSFNLAMGKVPTPPEVLRGGSNWPLQAGFSASDDEWTGAGAPRWGRGEEKKAGEGQRRPLWDVVERAKERREKDKSSPTSSDSPLPQSPPVSPSSYNFTLPPNSPLAASIAKKSVWGDAPRPTLQTQRFPLFTRSAEPSPTKSTFSALDQTRPPPEFKPRLSAAEFSSEAKLSASETKHARTKSELANVERSPPRETVSRLAEARQAPSRHTMRLPSLAQIQAKMSEGHRRGASVGSPEMPQHVRPQPRIRCARADSEESVEVLRTPTEEHPGAGGREPRIVLASILNRSRPATPPSPSAGSSPARKGDEKEPRLAPFLRERTNGRIAGRPASMPPMSLSLDELAALAAIGKGRSTTPQPQPSPSVRVTPPKERTHSITVPSPTKGSFPWTSGVAAAGSRPATPTSGRFNLANLAAITPPPRMSSTPSPRRSPRSPCSPTSLTSPTGTASPTLSIPMITCTPAPQTVLRDGMEMDSDEEEGDVVLFEGEVCESASEASDDDEREELGAGSFEGKEEREKMEREMKADAMKRRLMLRRRSD
ncbi:hypothetical protein IAT38_005151 [Cryptococcus sp. DSM 104549]